MHADADAAAAASSDSGAVAGAGVQVQVQLQVHVQVQVYQVQLEGYSTWEKSEIHRCQFLGWLPGSGLGSTEQYYRYSRGCIELQLL